MFGKDTSVTADTLDKTKSTVAASLDRLWAWVQEDVKKRVV
jgi:hypothetical protein